MKCQVEQNEHIRHLLLFAFKRDGKAVKASKVAHEICNVYGEDAVTEKTIKWWFTRFKNGNFDLKSLDDYDCSIKLDKDD